MAAGGHEARLGSTRVSRLAHFGSFKGRKGNRKQKRGARLSVHILNLSVSAQSCFGINAKLKLNEFGPVVGSGAGFLEDAQERLKRLQRMKIVAKYNLNLKLQNDV